MDTNIDNNISKIIKSCKTHNETLTKKKKKKKKKKKDFLNYIPKTNNFFNGLPKFTSLRKQKSVYIEISNSSDLKFRPIVETNKLSRVIDILLQSFPNKIKAILEITSTF